MRAGHEAPATLKLWLVMVAKSWNGLGVGGRVLYSEVSMSCKQFCSAKWRMLLSKARSFALHLGVQAQAASAIVADRPEIR